MSVFARFNELLVCAPEYPEAWCYFGLPACQELAPQLSAAEWNELRTRWRGESADWQDRVAQVAASGDAESVAPLLVEMVRSPHADVFARALESLCDLPADDVRAWFTPDDVAYIHATRAALTSKVNKIAVAHAVHVLGLTPGSAPGSSRSES